MTEPRWYDRIRLEHVLVGRGTILLGFAAFTPAAPGSIADRRQLQHPRAFPRAPARNRLTHAGPTRRHRRRQPTPHLKGGTAMTRHLLTSARTLFAAVALALIAPSSLLAQTPPNPWQEAIDQVQTAMTGGIARGLSLIAIVIGGMMFAFGEGGSKRTLAGIIFGVGMAMGAVQFLTWLTS